MLIEMDAKAAALWALLDDIDTLDDMAKENDAGYREHARRIQQKRFTIMSGEEWDAIREKYGKASSRNHDCHTPPPPTNADQSTLSDKAASAALPVLESTSPTPKGLSPVQLGSRHE